MLKPASLDRGDILAIDRAYIDYEKFEELTERGVVYVTKMKKNLRYTILSDTMYQTPDGLMEVRIQHVTFTKGLKGNKTLVHHARIITYADERKHKLVRLLTNDMESDPSEIIAIYRKRWEIELLFKQIKQNFPLKQIKQNFPPQVLREFGISNPLKQHKLSVIAFNLDL